MSEVSNPFEKFQSLKKISVTDEVKFKKTLEDLLAMDISSTEKVLNFQKQRDSLEKHFINELAENYFLTTTDVANADKKKRQEHYDQKIAPIYREYEEKLNKKFLSSDAAQKLKAPYDLLRRNQKNQLDIFCKDNIELQKEMDKLTAEIHEVQGKLLVNWQGERVPLAAIEPYLKSTNRQIRKTAYECIIDTKNGISDKIDEIFDRLLSLRQQVAKNSGFDNYTKYRFKEMHRFDWDETHCFDFHKAVKKHILPLKIKLLEKRKTSLTLDSVMPFDLAVDIHGRDPLRICEKNDFQFLIKGAEKIIKAIDPELHTYFCRIRDNQLLDLESRENKAPGGYMVMYPVYEQASVFANGVGMSTDLMTLLHELGHCFHYFLGRSIEPYALQEWTPEVAESGSMSMEFIGLEKMTEFLSPDKCERIKKDRLESTVKLFAHCGLVDEFQHWLYAHPAHSRQMRRDKWIELNRIYSPGVDFGDYEEKLSRSDWQFLHILQIPFYYIDYAISELVALTIWDRYKIDPADAIRRYKKGCSLGSTKTVPEIYEEFGTKLNFGEEVIAPLARRLETELGL